MPKPLKSPTLESNRQPFAEFLENFEMGQLNQDMTEALQDVVHACTTTGKPGSITFTLKVKPIGTSGQVEMDSDVKSKVPTEVRGKTLMFATPDNNLSRDNPKQRPIEGLRSADEEAKERTAVRQITESNQPLRAVGG